MDRRNENPPITCRYLKDEDFSKVHETFLEAFSDYLITFQLTREQLERHILLNAVDLNLSVGCFQDERLVGFTLNGFGMWGGKSTIYDAGTGVIPELQKAGIEPGNVRAHVPNVRGAPYKAMSPGSDHEKRPRGETIRAAWIFPEPHSYAAGMQRSDQSFTKGE